MVFGQQDPDPLRPYIEASLREEMYQDILDSCH